MQFMAQLSSEKLKAKNLYKLFVNANATSFFFVCTQPVN
jgi:hypothetical protein